MTIKLKKSDLLVKKTAVRKVKKKEYEVSDLKADIIKVLDDGKAEDIIAIDLEGKTSIADYIVIASGTSSRHISSLAENLGKKLKSDYRMKPTIEGKAGSEWVVIDAQDIIIHIFHPEVRGLYEIEEIWQ